MTMAGISSSSSREELQCQPAGYPTRSAVGGQPTFFVSKERRHESSEHTHGAHEASRSGPLAGSNWHQVAPSSKFQHTKWGRRRRKDHKRPSSSLDSLKKKCKNVHPKLSPPFLPAEVGRGARGWRRVCGMSVGPRAICHVRLAFVS